MLLMRDHATFPIYFRDQLRMRVEDCSKDGRTCPECNYVSHTTSDLMYHVARYFNLI